MLLRSARLEGCVHTHQHRNTAPGAVVRLPLPPHRARTGIGSKPAQAPVNRRCHIIRAATRTADRTSAKAGKELGPPFNVVITGSTKGVLSLAPAQHA